MASYGLSAAEFLKFKRNIFKRRKFSKVPFIQPSTSDQKQVTSKNFNFIFETARLSRAISDEQTPPTHRELKLMLGYYQERTPAPNPTLPEPNIGTSSTSKLSFTGPDELSESDPDEPNEFEYYWLGLDQGICIGGPELGALSTFGPASSPLKPSTSHTYEPNLDTESPHDGYIAPPPTPNPFKLPTAAGHDKIERKQKQPINRKHRKIKRKQKQPINRKHRKNPRPPTLDPFELPPPSYNTAITTVVHEIPSRAESPTYEFVQTDFARADPDFKPLAGQVNATVVHEIPPRAESPTYEFVQTDFARADPDFKPLAGQVNTYQGLRRLWTSCIGFSRRS